MPWAKVDDRLYSSVKWRTASKPARALWATALSWSAAQLTDGFIPTGMLPMLDGTRTEAASLEAAGLWEAEPGGWRFHDWHDYQPSRADVLAEREARGYAGIAGSHARWHEGRGVTDPSCVLCQSDAIPITPSIATALQSQSPRTRTRTDKNPPPTPTQPAGGENPRSQGTNPRSQGTNPRATGTNPRALGTNPRTLADGTPLTPTEPT